MILEELDLMTVVNGAFPKPGPTVDPDDITLTGSPGPEERGGGRGKDGFTHDHSYSMPSVISIASIGLRD
jgi:hypothetical protein